MTEQRIAKPENACLLVKLEGDPMSYAVSLPTDAMLMLVNVAEGLSERHVLTLVEFPGVEFKSSVSQRLAPTKKPIVYAKTNIIAREFAKTKDWNPTQWQFANCREHLQGLQGQVGLNESRELYLVCSSMTATEVFETRAEARARRFKVIEVSL